MIDEKKLIERFKQLKGSDSLANMFIKDVIKEIESQPKIDNWIPCSERFPEKEGTYIIHVVKGTGEDYVGMWLYQRGTHLSGKQTYVDDKNGYWASPYNGDPIPEGLTKNMIAWQPLPEPYSIKE